MLNTYDRPTLERTVHAVVEKPNRKTLPLSLAQAMISAAEQEANQKRELLEKERKELLDAAWAEGFKRGISELEQIALCHQKHRDEIFNQIKPQLLKLAFTLAEQVVGETIKSQPESLFRRLETCLQNIENKPLMRIFLHPEDLKQMEILFAASGRAANIALISDENMPRGAAKLTSDLGNWDLNPGEHLERLERHIQTNRLTDCVLSLSGPDGNEL